MTSLKVLVVEDEFVLADSIKRHLNKLGYNVAGVADNGEDAIEQAKEKKPDVVLMDIVLKGEMDGIDTAAEINKLDIPVIYLTTYVDKKVLERAKATGPFGYIVKPIEERGLNAAIEMAVYKHGIEGKLRKLEAEETLNAVLSNFVGDALNNRLAVIFGYLELSQSTDDVSEIKKFISKSTQSLDVLIGGARTFQTFSGFRGKTMENTSSEDLREILEPLLSENPLKIYDDKKIQIPSNISVKFGYDSGQKGALRLEELPLVLGEAYYIVTALNETLINAVESYSFRENKEEAEDVVISARREEDNVIIDISDKGMGMSQEELEECQLPFYKVPGVKVSGRLGLGAYIAQQSALYNGGYINITSEKDVGTTASISFKVSNLKG